MKLYFYRGRDPNFGDELNPWMWPQLLPGFFDEDDSSIFLGIGSILYDRFAEHTLKIVFGAGYGAYTAAPDVHAGRWDIYFVRGPQTAAALGLDPKLAICDAAVLLRTLPLPQAAKAASISFMPHVRSMELGMWAAVCERANIQLIDPRSPVPDVLARIAGTELLLAEAMHGAIVADALRVPWMAVRTLQQANAYKWTDWCGSLDLPYRPHAHVASGVEEYAASQFGWSTIGHRVGKHGMRLAERTMPWIHRPLSEAFVERAARSLRYVAQQAPSLSTERKIAEVTERMEEKLAELKRNHG